MRILAYIILANRIFASSQKYQISLRLLQAHYTMNLPRRLIVNLNKFLLHIYNMAVVICEC